MGWLGSPVRVGLATAIAGVALAAALVWASGGDVDQLVHSAPPNADPARVADGLDLRPTDEGFDGMFYYRVAASPLSTAEVADGIRLDMPAQRSARILYPALAAASGLGDVARLPWTLVGVNLVALAAVGYLGARWAADSGRTPLWGLLFAGYPGFVYTLGYDLTELVEATLVLGGAYLVHRRRWWAAGLALAGAGLTRETGIVLPLGLGAAWLWGYTSARWRSDGERTIPALVEVVPAVVPLATFAAWQLAVDHRFGTSGLANSSGHNLRLPLLGWMRAVDRFTPTSAENVFRDLSLALLVLVAVSAASAWRRSGLALGIRLGWLGSVVLLLMISENVYGGATSFMRAGTQSYVLGLAVVVAAPRRAMAFLVPPVGTVAALTLGAELLKAARVVP